MINKQLDTLFKRWEKNTQQDGVQSFCKDGLVLQEQNSEDVWNNSERRVVFLMKELLNPKVKDLRLILSDNNDWLTTRLCGSRMAAWLYGLTHTTTEGFPNIEAAFDEKNQVESFRSIPFSLVSINKHSKENASTNAEIYQYAEKHKQFLKEELAILNANVVVCCGEVVFRVLKNLIFPHSPFIKVNEWVYYERYTQTIIINSYLPSARKSNEEVYETMMEKLIEGLKIPTEDLVSLDKYISNKTEQQ